MASHGGPAGQWFELLFGSLSGRDMVSDGAET